MSEGNKETRPKNQKTRLKKHRILTMENKLLVMAGGRGLGDGDLRVHFRYEHWVMYRLKKKLDKGMAVIATLFQKRNEKSFIYWAFLSL